MSINFKAPQTDADLKPRIVVVGVGGAGGNAVNNMIRSNLEGVEFVVANTDAQALKHSQADLKIQLGANLTQGLGAGARPDVGRQAAEESMADAMEHLAGANMVFITAGMGGGTGTGAAPVLAEACREHGMLTVGVVTKPFHFEGAHRMRAAEQGIEELQEFVDTLIIIPNQNLFRVANEKTTFADAFKMADDVLYSGVRGVTDLMVMPGLINLDFADIRTVMSEMGKAMMGTGEAEGENRAILAAESAISNPLLEDVSMAGARGVLINITGGMDMTLFEVDEAANRIREEVDADANIIFGSTFDENLEGIMRVSVVATGIDSEIGQMNRPNLRTSITPLRARHVAPAADPNSEGIQQPEIAEATDAYGADPYEDTVSGPESGETWASDTEESHIDDSDLSGSPAHRPLAALFDDEPQGPAAEPVSRPTAPPIQDTPRPAATQQPLQATPQAVRPKDAFIPPRPVRPEELNRRTTARDAEPFREADLMNAGEAPAKSRDKNSLFSRVTGLGLGSAKAAPVKPTEPSLLRTDRPMPSPQTPMPTNAPAAQRAAEPVRPLEGDLAPSKAEEEMLEIPAFLRRQAN